MTPEKVTRSYEGLEQFLLNVGKAYLLEAALTFWGMEKLDDHPTQHSPPSGILHMTKEKKMEYFGEIIGILSMNLWQQIPTPRMKTVKQTESGLNHI